MKRLGLALSFVIGFATTANAGIFVEPYVGYGLGNYKVEAADFKGSLNGPVVGGRVGGQMNMLFIGADYSMSVGAKAKDDAGGPETDADNTNLYAVIGANLPIVRLWAGYGLMNQTKFKDPSGDSTIKDGTNFKLGVGFKVIPMLSLNLEYMMNSYKKVKIEGGTADLDSSVNTLLISASVPFSF